LIETQGKRTDERGDIRIKKIGNGTRGLQNYDTEKKRVRYWEREEGLKRGTQQTGGGNSGQRKEKVT